MPRKNPLTFSILQMLRKKLGPRLNPSRPDVESLIHQTLTQRDLANALSSVPFPQEIRFSGVTGSKRVTYKNGIITASLEFTPVLQGEDPRKIAITLEKFFPSGVWKVRPVGSGGGSPVLKMDVQISFPVEIISSF